MITGVCVECAKCQRQLTFSFGSNATFKCQSCGSDYGYIMPREETEELIKVFNVLCLKCKHEFLFRANYKVELRCVSCNHITLRINGVGELSKIIGDDDIPLPKIEILSKSPRLSEFSKSLKVVIPYYAGSHLVDRAVNTWLYPETVFSLTDKGTIPPGNGICSQFYTPFNATSVGAKKTKPFLRDILKRMYDLFPDEDFYGFFNSDIILPPGTHPKHLLPREGYGGVFHHRLLVSGSNHSKVRLLRKGNQDMLGKDGFIVNNEMMKTIINEFSNPIVGAPGWDDSLLLWLWKRFGQENIEARWGEIWHALHDMQWSYLDTDGKYNFKVLNRTSTHLYNWEKFYKRNQDWAKANVETIGIIQPGRIGDLILTLPIAYWYFKKGFKIIWPVASQFINILDYTPYVESVDIGTIGNYYTLAFDTFAERKVSKIIDLGIGFGRQERDWITSGLHFDEWKYKEAEVPFEEKYNLHIQREPFKEHQLYDAIMSQNRINGNGYLLVHENHSWSHYKWNVPNPVKVQTVDGFSLIDWLRIIEDAASLFCVDSCVCTLVDQLNLCQGRRFVKFADYKDVEGDSKRRKLLTLKLSKGWTVV